MKALTKQIGLVLILVLIVINVKAQKTFEEFKLITATYWYGEYVYSKYNEGDLLIIKGINGESLIASTLRLKRVGNKKYGNVYYIMQMQTVDSHEAGKIEWYEEIVKAEDFIDGTHDSYGKNTHQIESRRKNGNLFIIEYGGNSELRRFYIINEKEGTHIALKYLLEENSETK